MLRQICYLTFRLWVAVSSLSSPSNEFLAAPQIVSNWATRSHLFNRWKWFCRTAKIFEEVIIDAVLEVGLFNCDFLLWVTNEFQKLCSNLKSQLGISFLSGLVKRMSLTIVLPSKYVVTVVSKRCQSPDEIGNLNKGHQYCSPELASGQIENLNFC